MRYPIPACAHYFECDIKRSQFLVYIETVTSPAEAKLMIARIKSLHPTANHHCSAFIAGAPNDSQVLGFSDDGEPSGTAGKPMLNVLLGSGIGNVVAVVVRYFGGVKLGTGGLVRAYSGSLNQALATLPTELKVPTKPLAWQMAYSQQGAVEALLKQYDVSELEINYTEQLSIKLQVAEEQLSTLVAALSDLCHGQLDFITK